MYVSVMTERISLKFGMGGYSTAEFRLQMRENSVVLVPVECILICRASALAA